MNNNQNIYYRGQVIKFNGKTYSTTMAWPNGSETFLSSTELDRLQHLIDDELDDLDCAYYH